MSILKSEKHGIAYLLESLQNGLQNTGKSPLKLSLLGSHFEAIPNDMRFHVFHSSGITQNKWKSYDDKTHERFPRLPSFVMRCCHAW